MKNIYLLNTDPFTDKEISRKLKRVLKWLPCFNFPEIQVLRKKRKKDSNFINE